MITIIIYFLCGFVVYIGIGTLVAYISSIVNSSFNSEDALMATALWPLLILIMPSVCIAFCIKHLWDIRLNKKDKS